MLDTPAHCAATAVGVETSRVIGTFASEMALLIADEADGEREFSWRYFSFTSGGSVFSRSAFEADAGTGILIYRCLGAVHHRVTRLPALETASVERGGGEEEER